MLVKKETLTKDDESSPNVQPESTTAGSAKTENSIVISSPTTSTAAASTTTTTSSLANNHSSSIVRSAPSSNTIVNVTITTLTPNGVKTEIVTTLSKPTTAMEGEIKIEDDRASPSVKMETNDEDILVDGLGLG